MLKGANSCFLVNIDFMNQILEDIQNSENRLRKKYDGVQYENRIDTNASCK